MPIEEPEYVVISVTFNQEGALEIEWTDGTEHDTLGGTFHRTQITGAAREKLQQVGYWAQELTEDADELLYAWLKEAR